MRSFSRVHGGASRLVVGTTLLAALLLVTSAAGARPLSSALSDAFTYQGNLTDAGNPANGTYDFTFSMFDAAAAGSPVGSTLTFDDVTVTAGVFTVQLDFGAVFDGTALWLEIAVRPGASFGAYSTLAPRQELTATPYAHFALQAPWSGLTGVPAGFADGVDNGSAYQNLLVVAKSGGDYTTITDALNSITTANSANRFLIYVAPGVYSEQVTMKEYVDIQGSGELNTKITAPGATFGTVLGANNAELRFLTVESIGVSGGNALAIYNTSGGPRLTHVTASVTGGDYSWGIINQTYPTTMNDVTVTVIGGSSDSYGVQNVLGSPTMTNVTISVTGASTNYGVDNEIGASPTMTGVSVAAYGGSMSIGVSNYGASATIRRSTISAATATDNFGIFNAASSGSYTIRISDTQITGATNTIFNDDNFTVTVGASQLSGGAVSTGGGTLYCAGVYDENWNMMYVNSCP